MYKDMIDAGYNPIDADTDPTFTAGQLRMTVTGPWTTGGLDINGINYGIALVPEGMAGPMNSVEVIGFAIANVVSEEEQLAAYRFIEWWNTEDAEGNSPALTWSLENGFPSYAFSVQEKESYKSNEKLVVTSSADPSLPSDFIVDSSFAGANEILNDVILPLMSSITFEDISVEDALLFASMLMTMVRNADIVRIGCQSLIANISSCIMTHPGGEMWKQTIYYPFRLLARHARGTVLEVAGARVRVIGIGKGVVGILRQGAAVQGDGGVAAAGLMRCAGIGIVAGHLRLRVGQGSAPDGQGEGDDGVNGIARFDLVQSLKASP